MYDGTLSPRCTVSCSRECELSSLGVRDPRPSDDTLLWTGSTGPLLPRRRCESLLLFVQTPHRVSWYRRWSFVKDLPSSPSVSHSVGTHLCSGTSRRLHSPLGRKVLLYYFYPTRSIPHVELVSFPSHVSVHGSSTPLTGDYTRVTLRP